MKYIGLGLSSMCVLLTLLWWSLADHHDWKKDYLFARWSDLNSSCIERRGSLLRLGDEYRCIKSDALLPFAPGGQWGPSFTADVEPEAR